MREFERIFNISDNTKILDVGGTQFIWKFISKKPRITILNLNKPEDWEEKENFEFIKGDATSLNFNDKEFDIVFSNSVIEHLKSYENQIKMANEIMRVGKKVYLQTPAKEFFVEPHLITPFIHWFPRKVQEKLIRNFTIWGLITRPSDIEIKNFLDEVRLLNYNEIKELFPNSEIIREKFIFWTKSFIVIKK